MVFIENSTVSISRSRLPASRTAGRVSTRRTTAAQVALTGGIGEKGQAAFAEVLTAWHEAKVDG
ncbi:hypothetical protein [Streptomyces sp. NPDC088915]|uniref:hypothetical protein n=1 Tax=Streptomyces sp. NPDC088915 TaxID=3365912 RepID=UPI00380DB604